ncbi:peptidoglycan-binding domain-containing protein [Streptomyces sp. Ju416(a)]|uniref:peptidoglycan-binding protein n=1 Tax=Streptomyces sp. Ju416(a) TaxID=3446591 RepID=UPI00403E0007
MHRTHVARVAAVALAAAAFTAFAPAVPAIAGPTVRAAEKCPGVSTVGRYCGYHAGTQWAELGSQGNHVKEIQALINETTRYGEPGGTKLVVDGIYGAKTKSAVTWFQWYYGSEAISDGIVGPQTWEMLRYGKR